jgi:hypothetical protein
MRTEYIVGNIRIPFASQARRRWPVKLVYTSLALLLFAQFTDFLRPIVSGCLILVVGLMIIFTWLACDMRTRGDEREMHRRDHAHYLAYYSPTYGLVGALFAGYFRSPNPIAPLLPLALRGCLIEFPSIILWATGVLYFTLPQAILLWTEPDMEQEPVLESPANRRSFRCPALAMLLFLVVRVG